MKVILKTVFAAMAATAALVGCAEGVGADYERGVEGSADGKLSVRMEYDDVLTKAQTSDYLSALDGEKAVKSVSVLVFDKSTGLLNASKTLASLSEECQLTLPVGEKLIYAVVNGPALGSVTTLNQFNALTDNMMQSDPETDGFTLIGSETCAVESGKTAAPTVVVKWLAARVVLDKITCNVASQYGGMTVDCVYLANANTVQTFSGVASAPVNPDGYADEEKKRPIGKSGETGACPVYLYRTVGVDVSSGQSVENPYYMYCQPNESSSYTCLYVLATIGGQQYYYRVPLNKSLKANYTYSVDLTIANLGSVTPPSEDYQNGAVKAVISIGNWTVGSSYVAEF